MPGIGNIFDGLFKPAGVGETRKLDGKKQGYASRYGDWTAGERLGNAGQGASRGAMMGLQVGGPWGALVGGAVGGLTGLAEGKNLTEYERQLMGKMDQLEKLRRGDGSFRGMTDEQRALAVMGNENQLAVANQQAARLRGGAGVAAGMGSGGAANYEAAAMATQQDGRTQLARDLFAKEQEAAAANEQAYFEGAGTISAGEDARRAKEEQQTTDAQMGWASMFAEQMATEGGMFAGQDGMSPRMREAAKLAKEMGVSVDEGQVLQITREWGIPDADARAILRTGKLAPEQTAAAMSQFGPDPLDSPPNAQAAQIAGQVRGMDPASRAQFNIDDDELLVGRM